MLYVQLEGGVEIGWHVGEDTTRIRTNASLVSFVQADGDELTHIIAAFTRGHFYDGRDTCTIPVSNRPVQRWYGDIAKTIVFALKGA